MPVTSNPATRSEDGLAWYDVREWGVEGKTWEDTERFFDRLPGRAEAMVREPVWNLSRHSAGMCVRFETDAPCVSAKWSLLSKSLAMDHMPSTGVSGLDLYVKDDSGEWGWLGVGRPSGESTTASLVAGLPPKRRLFMLYLPLYNGTESLEVGVSWGAGFWPAEPREDQPIVFYGTSIMQGGCASRPGMAHAAILGRRLDLPIVNLGFSGNGRMDLELAELMAEIDAGLYFLDCAPNMNGALISHRAVPFVRILREARPDTPIVLVEDRTYCHANTVPRVRRGNKSRRSALHNAYQRLKSMNVPNLHYVSGEQLLGDDGEATVDGSHPTDVGFMRMADVLEPVLRGIVTDQ